MPSVTRRNALKLAVLGPLVAGCGAARTTPAASPTMSTATTPTASGDWSRDVRSFGAVGDGRTDDTAALTRALAALPSGGTLTFPAGKVFPHADVLIVTASGATLSGGGTLLATAEGTSALQLMADAVRVSGLTLAVASTTHRWSAPDQHRLFLGPQSGLAIDGVVVTGSAAAGVFSYGAQHFTLDRVQVRDTRADGIHMTNGSAYGTVSGPQVSRSGDDGVAVVSYESDGKPCHDITVSSPVIRTTTGGRGLSVVGGHDVSYRDIDVDRSAAAGVYLACEGDPYNTFPTQRVMVTGGRITHANTDASIDHGAVLAYSGRSGGDVTTLTVSHLSISGTRSTASRQIGAVSDSGGGLSDVTFSDLTLAGSPSPYEGNVDPTALHLTDVLAAGIPVSA